MPHRATVEVSLRTLRALLDYQAERASDVALADLADAAILDWLQRQGKAANPAGFFWKTVFLPDGTRLRISSCQGQHFAEVVCGELIYDSRRLSPNQFVTACLGNVGNAWNSIYVQLPGEGDWTQARCLRHMAAAHALRTAKRKTECTASPAGYPYKS